MRLTFEHLLIVTALVVACGPSNEALKKKLTEVGGKCMPFLLELGEVPPNFNPGTFCFCTVYELKTTEQCKKEQTP